MDIDVSAAVLAVLFVRQCAVQNRNLNEVLLGIIDALLDGCGGFLGLTETVTDNAVLIAYDNKCCESESRPPLVTLVTRLMLTRRSLNSISLDFTLFTLTSAITN